jgi:predicted AAA+ superfamily ATPase
LDCSREVARQLIWAEEPAQLFHYRDRDQVEVDMVLEHAVGTVIGIEVKARPPRPSGLRTSADCAT